MSEESDPNDWLEMTNSLLVSLVFNTAEPGIRKRYSEGDFEIISWKTGSHKTMCQQIFLSTGNHHMFDDSKLRLVLYNATKGTPIRYCRWILSSNLKRNLFVPGKPGTFYFQIKRK